VTHSELIEIARNWLKDEINCGAVITNAVSSNCGGEAPDVVGFRAGNFSYLVECITSRGHFLADKKNPARLKSGRGVGRARYYLSEGLIIKADDVRQSGWGLLRIDASGKAVKRSESQIFKFSEESERDLMYSALSQIK